MPGRVVRWSLERAPPLLGCFDVCRCIEVAEHVPRPSAARAGEMEATLKAAISDVPEVSCMHSNLMVLARARPDERP